MKNYLKTLNEYLFEHKAFLIGKIPSQYLSARKKQRQEELMAFFFDEEDTLVYDKGKFRAALKAINNTSLEEMIFENNEEKSHLVYSMPNEIEITENFLGLNNQYQFFDEQTYRQLIPHFHTYFKLFKIIGDCFESSNDAKNETVYKQTYKALVLFDTHADKKNIFRSIDDYIEKFNFAEEYTTPIHDALTYTLPTNNPKNPIHLDAWKNIIFQRGLKACRLFQLAPKIELKLGEIHLQNSFGRIETSLTETENKLKALYRKLGLEWKNISPTNQSGADNTNNSLIVAPVAPQSYIEALNIAKGVTYCRENEYPELAKLCHEFTVSEEAFNECLELEKKAKPIEYLPQIFLEKEFASTTNLPDRYYFVHLPLGDPRAYLLGHFTGCCQSIDGEGKQCVIDGVQSPYSGFYVLLKQITDNNEKLFIGRKINYQHFKIVGQGYAWISELGNLILDSWEADKSVEDEISIYFLEQFAAEVTRRTHSPILQVKIGTGGNTPKKYKDVSKKCPTIELMRAGTQYTDSLYGQALLGKNEEKHSEIKNKLTVEIFNKVCKYTSHDYLRQIVDKAIISIRQYNEIMEILNKELYKNIDSVFVDSSYSDASKLFTIKILYAYHMELGFFKFNNIDDKKLLELFRNSAREQILSLLINSHSTGSLLTYLFELHKSNLLTEEICDRLLVVADKHADFDLDVFLSVLRTFHQPLLDLIPFLEDIGTKDLTTFKRKLVLNMTFSSSKLFRLELENENSVLAFVFPILYAHHRDVDALLEKFKTLFYANITDEFTYRQHVGWMESGEFGEIIPSFKK